MSKILYVTPKQLYDSKMSIGRRLYVESLRTDGCRVDITGPGWPDWFVDDLGAFLERQRVYGEEAPDAIIAYKTGYIANMDASGVPVATCFNEANDRTKTLDDLEATQATDVFFHHVSDYVKWVDELVQKGKRCHLTHHCAPENPNGNRPFQDRDIAIGLCGVISPEIYPVRTAFAESGICSIRRHPGYRIPNVLQQYDDYMQWLSRVKVLVCCSSKYKYPLAKIHEGLAAGCVVVSDSPECPFLRGIPYLNAIDNRQATALTTDREAVIRMKDRLTELGQQAEQGGWPDKSIQQWKNRFTMSHWARNFLSSMRLNGY